MLENLGGGNMPRRERGGRHVRRHSKRKEPAKGGYRKEVFSIYFKSRALAWGRTNSRTRGKDLRKEPLG